MVIFIQSCEVNDIVDYKYSPDGKYIAISYIRDAGATTAFSVHTSIVKSWEKLKNNRGMYLLETDRHL
ncbi:MAG: DUF5412 family protein [Treponema sp.]|jgi:hypothetical protein|nr:DUF5412 family protein [Treponema sp.]